LPLATRPVDSVIDLRATQRAKVEAWHLVLFHWLLREIHQPAAFLFPLRIFIGVGWMRSFAEKFTDPAWLGGRAVGNFLGDQTVNGAVPIPQYDWLIDAVLSPAGPVIGWLVMLLQLVIGLAIISGTDTNLAFLIGIVMNVNFMLAGEINPSAFYIVIQTVLFVMGAGGVIGFDSVLAKQRPTPSLLIVARPDPRETSERDRTAIDVLALLAGLMSWLGFAHVNDFSPTGITDPGLVLGTVMAVTTFSLLILRLRLVDLSPVFATKPDPGWTLLGREKVRDLRR